MSSATPPRFSSLMALVAALASAIQTPAEPRDQTRFRGSPVAITPPQQSGGPVWLHLRLRMDDGECKISRKRGDGGYRELFFVREGTLEQKLSPGEVIQLDPQGHSGEYSVRFEPINAAAGVRAAAASGFGMIVVAIGAVIAWRRISSAGFGWFWIGAGLWTVAVAFKVACALVSNAAVIGLLRSKLSYPLLVAMGGLFLGIESSLCEMGFTLLAVGIWRQLGEDAGRAIAIGVGAGAFEASLLGLGQLAMATAAIAGLPGTEGVGDELGKAATLTPLVGLVGPAERVIAILCHASSRALILLGMARRRLMMIVWGCVIFTAIDGIAGATQVSGRRGTYSSWWLELALLPVALVSIPILIWCYKTSWPDQAKTRLGNAENGP